MVGGKKSTKKFVQNRLPDVLERRKANAKIKQRHQLNDKRKEKVLLAAPKPKPPQQQTRSKRRKKMPFPK